MVIEQTSSNATITQAVAEAARAAKEAMSTAEAEKSQNA